MSRIDPFALPPLATPGPHRPMSPGEHALLLSEIGETDLVIIVDGGRRILAPRVDVIAHAYPFGSGVERLLSAAPQGFCWEWTVPAADADGAYVGGSVQLTRLPTDAN